MKNIGNISIKKIFFFLIVFSLSYTNFIFAQAATQSDQDKKVVLTSFTAKYHTGKVYLNWTVQSQTDNNIYVVEKSNDNKTFKTFFMQEASISTANQDLLYSVIDSNPGAGNVNYNVYNVTETSKDLLGSVEVVCPNDMTPSSQVSLQFTSIPMAAK